MLLLVSAALAADPGASATLTWSRGEARVALQAPAGSHVAADAPTTVSVGGVTIEGMGDLSAVRFPLGEGAVKGDVAFAVCTDVGSTCTPVRLHVEGTLAGKKGSLAFAPPKAATAGAGGAGAAVRLYDFGAVWCPPCNLLAAEILHDPDDAGLLSGLDVVAIDVDKPDSWTLKDRYAVGGYPTLVAVDAAGDEVARLVGYPGEAPTKAWIAGLATAVPLHQLLTGEPSGTPAERAAVARRLAEGQYDDAARRWLTGADDGIDAHIARLTLDGRPEDVAWLYANAPAGPWLAEALSADSATWPKALPLIATLSPSDAADMLSLVADIVDGDAGKALRAAAIAALRSTFTGDAEHDRAHITFLADLYAGMGDPAAALTVLDEYAGRYPGEFTFDHAATRLLVDEKRWAEAEARGRVSLGKAWGDQRLRAVQPLARAIAEQGRQAEAIALLTAELDAAPVPGEGVEVRTTRYRAQVEALRRELPANTTTGVTPPPKQ